MKVLWNYANFKPSVPLTCLVFKATCSKHSLDQMPTSASFQSCTEHGAPPFSFQRGAECILSLESTLENLPTTFEVEKLRHRKVKKFTRIYIYSQIRRKLGGKSKFPGTGEMARCFKALATLQRAQVGFPGPGRAQPTEAPVPRDRPAPSGLSGYCMQVVHIHACRKKPI